MALSIERLQIFDVKGSEKGIDYRVLEEARKYAMGWDAGSNMNATYNDKRLAAKAREISLGHQKRTDRQK